jgi:hypothetical protein
MIGTDKTGIHQATIHQAGPSKPKALALACIGLFALLAPAAGAGGFRPTIYGVDLETDQLITIDEITGETSVIGALGGDYNIAGLTYDISRDVLYAIDASTDSLLEVNRYTGAASVVGSMGFPHESTSLIYDRNTDRLLGQSNETNYFVTLNRDTGAATMNGTLDDFLLDLAIDQDSAQAFGLSRYQGDGPRIVSVDFDAGTSTSLIQLEKIAEPAYMTYDPFSQSFFVLDNMNDQFYSVDRASGEQSLIATLDFRGITDLAIVVPSPSPIGVLSVASLCGCIRRRR